MRKCFGIDLIQKIFHIMYLNAIAAKNGERDRVY